MNFFILFVFCLFLNFSSPAVGQNNGRDWGMGTSGSSWTNGMGMDSRLTEIHGRVIYQRKNVHDAFKFGKITKTEAGVLDRELVVIHRDALNAFYHGQGANQLTAEEQKSFTERLDINKKKLDDFMSAPKAVKILKLETKPTVIPSPVQTLDSE